ncbi:hypothetical protein QR680_010708 [Steinernema hermaphroditum]|uniref:Uncharacterized protein n=1 Tax=Steinernema hermaphroditum TaxID=289476 RepID=A0AA39IRD7_9BILA|nr:hypothetical protein QR680_010708 [Steinernema hermaphroditum]
MDSVPFIFCVDVLERLSRGNLFTMADHLSGQWRSAAQRFAELKRYLFVTISKDSEGWCLRMLRHLLHLKASLPHRDVLPSATTVITLEEVLHLATSKEVLLLMDLIVASLPHLLDALLRPTQANPLKSLNLRKTASGDGKRVIL